MSKGIFVTGTGTDVGKTFFAALAVKKLLHHGLHAGYYKAVLSGAEHQDGKLVAGDADYVCRVSGLTADASIVSYMYETAASPHLAALIDGRPVEMSKVLRDFEVMKRQFDYLTVEGCGGIVCPIIMDEQTIMQTDIIKALGLDLLIVASAGLGTINSTVLTAEYAKQQGIRTRGIVLNSFEVDNFIHTDNKKQIERLTGIPVLACVGKHATELDLDMKTLTDLYGEI